MPVASVTQSEVTPPRRCGPNPDPDSDPNPDYNPNSNPDSDPDPYPNPYPNPYPYPNPTFTPTPTQGDPAKMLWHADNGFWHAGERRHLGQRTGWLIVSDVAALPEHIVAVWKMERGGRFVDARRLGCVRVRAREEEEEGAEGVEGQEEEEEGEEEEEDDDDSQDDDDDDAIDHDDGHHNGGGEGGDDRGHIVDHNGGDDEEMEQVLGLRRGAVGRRRLRRGAREVELAGGGGGGGGGHAEGVTLMGELPLRRRSLPLTRRMAARVYLGEYLWSRSLNGKPAYVHAADHRRMLWWCDGWWHAGAAVDAGLPRAILIARDDGHANAPEEITALWEVAGDGNHGRGWVEAPFLICALTSDVDPRYRGRWQDRLCPFPPLRLLWFLLFLYLLCSPELLDIIGWYDGRWYDDR